MTFSMANSDASTSLSKQSSAALPLALTLIAITLCIPVEMSFYIIGLRLTATRLLLLILAPVVLIKALKKSKSSRFRFVYSDLFVALFGFWMVFAPAMIDDLGGALNHAGPDVLEFGISYLATRVLLTKHGQALAFIELLCRVITIAAVIGLLDPLTGSYFTHVLSNQLTGAHMPVTVAWEDAYRLGLLRAAGPIEHPILYGFNCVICLLIASSVPMKGRYIMMISCLLGALFSFSSAPIQCIILGFCLKGYNRIFISNPYRWLVVIGGGVLAIVAAFLFSNSPVGFVVSNLIFSSDSGFYRVWTWDRVIYFVSQSPWYGLGYGEPPEDLNHSIDSLWLVLAMRAGVPGAILAALALIGAASLPTSGRKIDLTPAERKLGMILGILIFLTIFVSFTVDLWGPTWILTGLLIGMRAHLGELGQLKPATSTQNAASAQNVIGLLGKAPDFSSGAIIVDDALDRPTLLSVAQGRAPQLNARKALQAGS